MTYPNPPQYPVQQPMAYPTPQKSSTNPVLIGIAAGLGIIIVALAVFLVVLILGGHNKSGAETNAAQPQSQPTSTVTVSPAPTVTVQQQPTQTQHVSGGQIPWPPNGATATCGSTVAVNNVTSCDFAQNVADAYRSSGTGAVYAYSPVTNVEYKMNCQLSQASVVVCTGGKNAVVYIQQ